MALDYFNRLYTRSFLHLIGLLTETARKNYVNSGYFQLKKCGQKWTIFVGNS